MVHEILLSADAKWKVNIIEDEFSKRCSGLREEDVGLLAAPGHALVETRSLLESITDFGRRTTPMTDCCISQDVTVFRREALHCVRTGLPACGHELHAPKSSS